METIEVPADVQVEADRLHTVGLGALAGNEFAQALAAFRGVLALYLSVQTEYQRVHKGAPLFSMGLSAWHLGRLRDAVKFTLRSYIEDVIDAAQQNRPLSDALNAPATQTLVELFSLAPTALAGSGETIHQAVRDGAPWTVPEAAEHAFGLSSLWDGLPEQITDRREVGVFTSRWERRVFIGGAYRTHPAVVSRLADIVTQQGFDPVVEWDFEIPPRHIHHHALMLLHSCAHVIFEVSFEAGQLMELERCRDYGIEALVVRQGIGGHGSTSEMVATLAGRHGEVTRSYGSDEELRTLVGDYLGRDEGLR